MKNQTFRAKQGKKPDVLEMKANVIAHETQYAIHIDFFENKKKRKEIGILRLEILDQERILYRENKNIKEGDFKDNNLVVFLPYKKVPKSFYDKGNLLVRFESEEERLEIPIKKYSEEERLKEQEREFLKNSKKLNNQTDYVGFRLNVTRTGYYIERTTKRRKVVRFDTKIENLLDRPQYLIRQDFYIKDSDKNFYPLYGKISTYFGPLLKIGEKVNASFYFNIIKEKKSYSFYYGDRKLAEFKVN